MTEPPNSRLLVAGASGFLGRAIMARAGERGLDVIPATRQTVDLRDGRALAAYLGQVRPDFVIDAAGVLPGRGSVEDNVTITRGWIDALDMVRDAPRLVLSGSAAVYGTGAAQGRATREDDPMRPVTEYGRAKHAAMALGRMAHERDGHDVQTGIVFNLMGAGQAADLVPQEFIRKALTARGGRYAVGNVDAVRDFMDVEDAADALVSMALHGKPGEVANVATGRPTRIRDLLDALRERLGADWTSRCTGEGPAEPDVCYGDPARLKARTGWQPSHDLETALGRAIAASGAQPQARSEA